jgi:hypothetical protein
MPEEFRTRELHEASGIAIFVKPLRLEYFDEKQREIAFVFPVEAKEYSDKYWNNNLMVDARGFANSFKEMKIRLFAFKDQQEENHG